MVTIRLARGGARKRPFYQIVVADRRSPRDGRMLERIGFFNPLEPETGTRLRIDLERLEYWTARGARPSERVAALLSAYRRNPPPAPATASGVE
jgi:small subunit ribosomal protein S16